MNLDETKRGLCLEIAEEIVRQFDLGDSAVEDIKDIIYLYLPLTYAEAKEIMDNLQ